ncbi:VanZ family protein [Bacillus thuringiensis]|uniref:VanZ family protein n=1 Tax=Bacillus thuringiensis TaxID=1428 RepID=UPI000A3820B3|nr:VanZ family protein [Bacillus thuringiensis]MED3068145.1 VanZ family protein [Bacillus thuringiensis]OUB32359.1 VanZ family protein [Bacillus thuringiensis serovar palmanyolensis]
MNIIFDLIASYAIPAILLTFLLHILFVFSYFVVYKKICKRETKLTVKQIILLVLITGYYSLALSATSFGRSDDMAFARTIDFDILSVYKKAWNTFSFPSFFHIIVNIGMLFPLGILFPLFSKVFQKIKWMLIISIIASLLIEILEFTLQRGSMELADLLHNTLGMMLGYSVLNIVLIFLKKNETDTKIIKYLYLPITVSFVALGIIISYQMKEFGNMPIDPITKTDMSQVTIKTSIELKDKGKRMPVYKEDATKKSNVRDVEILSPKEALQKLKQGDFDPIVSFKAGDTLFITKYNIDYYTDTKGFSQPIYVFEVHLNGKDIWSQPISAKK